MEIGRFIEDCLIDPGMRICDLKQRLILFNILNQLFRFGELDLSVNPL